MGLSYANDQFIAGRRWLRYVGENLIKELRKVLEGLPVRVDWGICDCNSTLYDVIGIYSREDVSIDEAHYGLGEEVRDILNSGIMLYGAFSKETAKEIVKRLREAMSQREE